MPAARRIAFAAPGALCAGLTAVVVLEGFSPSGPVKLLETLAVVGFAAAVLFGAAITIGLRLADYREPESEEDFERVVQRAERLAREGTAAEPDETDFLELDPYDDDDFEELVRDALDDLPDLLRNLVENHNVAVVISDGGRRRRAYGLYHGDGADRRCRRRARARPGGDGRRRPRRADLQALQARLDRALPRGADRPDH